MSRKKGDLTSKQLVTIIILVLSFAIILFFYLQFDWKGQITREACHESIVLRSTFNYKFIEPGKKLIPLKCQTEKICISTDGRADCGIDTKDNPVKKVRISEDPSKAKEEILELFANALYDCHSLVGEGKLNFMPTSTWSENYCLICSRIVFNSSSASKLQPILYKDLYAYLQQKKTPEGKSYLSYIYPAWTDMNKVREAFDKMKSDALDNEALKNSYKDVTFDNWALFPQYNEGYVIQTQLTPKGTFGAKVGAAAIGIGTGVAVLMIGAGIAYFLTAPISVPTTLVIVSGSTILAASSTTTVPVLTVGTIATLAGKGVFAGAITGSLGYWQLHPDGKLIYKSPTIIPYNVDELKNLKCTSFEFAP